MKEFGDYTHNNSEIYNKAEEQQVAKLMRFLEGWRMAILPLKSILLWEQQWYPCAIIGSVTILFVSIWAMNLNAIAAFAVFGLIINFIDFIVPIICNTIYSPSSWTGQKEKMFEDICRNIVIHYNQCMNSISSFYSLRTKSPLMYYMVSIGTLCFVTWITSAFNSIFILYIFSIVLVLWPGIEHKGVFNFIYSLFLKKPKSS